MNKSLSLQEFIDLDELQVIQDNFAKTIGISSVVFSTKGEPLTRFTNPTGFCSLIQSTEEGKRRCARSFIEMSEKALEFKEPQIFYCFAHGGHFVAPIIINGEHKATMFAGQFISQSFSASQLEELEKIAVDINIDPVQLIKEAKQMRVIDKDALRNNASLMFRIEKIITRLGVQASELQQAHNNLEIRVRERTTELVKSNEEINQKIIERKQADEALQKSEEKFRNLVETIKEQIWEVNADGIYTYISPTTRKIYGLEPEEVVGKTPFDLMPPEEAQRVAGVFEKIVQSRKAFSNLENITLHKDGHQIIMETSGVPFFTPDGTLLGYRGIARDITQRKLAEKTLQESEKKYRNIIENIQEVYYRSDGEGNLIMLSPSGARIFGCNSIEDMIGLNISRTFYAVPEERDAFLKILTEKGKVSNYEIILKKQDGTQIPVLVSSHLYFDKSGNPLGVEGIIFDITDRKRFEIALEHRVEFEKLITDISTSFINITPDEVDAGIQDALQKIGEFSGVDRSYVFLFFDNNKKIDNTHEWCAEGIDPQINNLKGLEAVDFPWIMGKLNKSEAIYIPRVANLPPEASAEKEILQLQDIRSLVIVPMVHSGTLTGYLGFDSVGLEKTWPEENIILLKMVGEMFVNALERRRAEEALESSETKFFSMFEKNPLGAIIVDKNRKVREVNDTAATLIGIPKKEILDHVCHGFLCTRAINDCPIFDHGQTLDHQEVILLSKDRGEVSIEKTVTQIIIDNETMLLEMFSDITERKQAEKMEAAYTDILTISNKTLDLHTIITEGLDSLMKYTDSQAGAVYLYDPISKMIVPNVIRGMKKTVAKQKFSSGEDIVGEAAQKQEMIIITSIPADTIYTIKSGSKHIIPATIISTPMIFKGTLLGVVVTCHTINIPPDVLIFIKRVIDQYAVALNNANTLIQVHEMAARLTNQRDELEIKSHELEAASKTKSEFLANMSHELRTPLNSIIGFSEILHDGTFGPLNEKQTKYISNVLTSGKHLLNLINGILDLAKVEAGKMELICEDFNVLEVFDESVMLLSSVASKKNIVLSTAVEKELTTVHADAGKFKQILYNLMSNAIKFTPVGGSVTVEAHRSGDMAHIAVSDTGIGISKEEQDKLFEPFMQVDASSSRQYQGTGLGLSLVKRFVEMHGGRVWVESEPDKGSTFTFTIPIKKD